MPLIACPECKREVSNKASSCPHCGAPVALKSDTMLTRNRGCGDLALYGVAVPLILGAVAFLVWLLSL